MSGLGTSRRLSAPKNLVTVGLWRTSIKPRQLKLDLRIRTLGPALIQSEPNRLGPGLDGTPAAQNKAARLLFANGRSCRRQGGAGTAPEASAFKFDLHITPAAGRWCAAASCVCGASP